MALVTQGSLKYSIWLYILVSFYPTLPLEYYSSPGNSTEKTSSSTLSKRTSDNFRNVTLSFVIEHFGMARLEKVTLGYSPKNIPVVKKERYLTELIRKTEAFMHHLEWKVHFYLQPQTISATKNRYGFRTDQRPKPEPMLKEFKCKIADMIGS